MKAVVFHGIGDIRLDNVKEPKIKESTDAIVRLTASAICGTDLHEYLAGPIFIPPPGSPHPLTGETLPLTLGHEFAGEVVDVLLLGIGVPSKYFTFPVASSASAAAVTLNRARRLTPQTTK